MPKYFTLDEFKCSETGKNNIDPAFVDKLDRLREDCGFPFIVTSGYRDPSHSAERHKRRPGRHTYGIAADIAYNDGAQLYKIINNALKHGFTGIGIAEDFVHLDIRSGQRAAWTY